MKENGKGLHASGCSFVNPCKGAIKDKSAAVSCGIANPFPSSLVKVPVCSNVICQFYYDCGQCCQLRYKQ